jgi:PAS domain S-box-containing protein
MYFGTNRGLLYFPYQEIKNNHNIEGLTIAGVSINGIEIDLTEHKLLKKAPYVTDSLILPHNKNNISIHCCIDPVILSKSTTYKYKLEGVDNEWQTLPSNSNIITYNNLAGGDHLLSIKTNNEAFSKDLFIQIKLPFYNQKWFRFLIILLICILIFILLKLRRKSHENEKSFLIEKSREILFDEKRQFKTLIDNIPDLIYIKNTDHQYVIVNKQMTKTLGIKNTNDLIGRTDVDFYPKELAELYKKDENAILSEGKHIISKDEIGLDEKGNTRYISTTKVPLRNSKDEIVGLLGIGRDITKQKIAEQKLIEHSDNLQEINTLLEERQEEIQQQSDELLEQRNRINKEKERLQTLIDSMPDVIYFKDRYANFITANKTLLRIMGVDALEDVQGKSDLDFFDAELAEKFMADDLSIIKSGTPLINKEEPGIDEHGKRIVRSTTKIPLRDKNGLVTGLIGIGRDISSQKLAETKLQEQANNLKEINVLLEERQEEIEHQSHQLSEQSNKLQKEHNQLRTLIDALPEVIYFKDKEARFITANQKLVNIMKAGSIENLTGKTDHDFYDKELADEFYEDDMKIIREGLPILNKKERGFDIEGNERYIETSKIPVKDKKGKVTGLIGIGKDITEKVEADDKLREQADNLSEVNVLLEERQEEIYQQSEELKEKQLLLTKERNQLRTLIDTMPDVIYFKNSRAEFITANETLIQIMKAKNQEGIAGKTDFDFYEEDLARKFYEDDMQVIKSGTAIINKEETGYDLSGMKRIMSTTKVPLKDRQNKVIGLVGIGRDITKQKQAERKLIQQADDLKEINVLLEERQEEIQQQAEELNATAESLREANTELEKLNKTKNKFFSIIAHDLKNPFHAIFGFSELLLQNQTELDPQREKELIELIKSSSETAYNLLENLLQWARTQTDRIKYNPERTDVIELIENNISFAELSLTKKNLKLNKQLQQNTFAYIDKNMINTVIRNLLSNAIKFTEKGGEITIEAFAKKEQTIIKIQDNGIGIPEENLKRLFRIDQYFTTEGTSGESGTGLGLIVCKEFVEKNHGSMKIQSKLDFGTVFTISLPSEEF